MERHKAWADLCEFGVFPSLWFELGGIFAIKIRVAMHMVDRVANACAAGNENW